MQVRYIIQSILKKIKSLTIRHESQGIPTRHFKALGVGLSILFFAWFWPFGKDSRNTDPSLEQQPTEQEHLTPLDDLADEESHDDAIQEQALPQEKVSIHSIQEGDTLSTIFDQYSVGLTTLNLILEADEQLLALDILRPGHKLTFYQDPDNLTLNKMELYIHPGNQVVYSRVDENNYEFQEIIHPGEWQQEIIVGEIIGNFYISAKREGLSDAEIYEVNRLLGEQLDFRRQIQKHDRFQVIRNIQYVDGFATGQSTLEAIRIQQRNKNYTAILFEDGSYYDATGDSITRAFRRIPHNQNFRISSAFNPKRRHPVTRRISPHNGTDFAMPTGTPIVSTGDGRVTRVENHPFAGRYIEIQHGSTYKTRYLHMSRIDVKRGQSVKRGERIGLSGATGRVTGPHLHFELHINGRPTNPMTANLPLAKSVPREKMAAFNALVEERLSLMTKAQEEYQVAFK